jgi:hypothetical protein
MERLIWSRGFFSLAGLRRAKTLLLGLVVMFSPPSRMLAGSATCGMVRDFDQPTVLKQLGSCNGSDML